MGSTTLDPDTLYREELEALRILVGGAIHRPPHDITDMGMSALFLMHARLSRMIDVAPPMPQPQPRSN
jgi:hypothetical protein